ncbi:MAG TPA: hypothetical protein VMV21_15020, partial [Vicinamibacteria bacterium]|nr:hypothetical protein [Vicinamibacteria bacterium]
MKGLWAVAADELRSKRALLTGMLALGALPWAAPYFPGLHRFDAADVRSAFMILVGLSLPPALGLGLGASAVGEEIGGRRLGFYFARPIGAGAIWGGKMLVALLVPLLAALVVFIPGAVVLLAGKREVLEALGGTAVLSALLCGLAHVGAGLYRTRSPWLALDLVAGALVFGGFYLVGHQMVDGGAAEGAARSGPWLAGVLLVCCLGAGLAQVAFGRTDPQQGHMALAGVLWGGLLLSLGIVSAASSWYLSPTPAEL